MGNYQRVVQVIYNQNLHRLTEVEVVKEFMWRQGFKVAPSDLDFGLILYKLPYVIEFKDALIENYLEIYFSDISSACYMNEGDSIWCSISIGMQSREELKRLSFECHGQLDIFLSEGPQKMYGLQTTLKAIDKLLPLIEAKGGLASMHDGTFNSRIDFKDSVKPMWHGMKERYLRCIAQVESFQ